MAVKKNNDQQQQIIALVAVALILGFVFREKIFGKASTSKANVRGGAGAPPGVPGGAPAGPGGAPRDAAPAAPTVTPAQIPVLTPEIKRKIKERKGSQDSAYSKEKLESGANPFIPFTVDIDALERARDANPGPSSAASKAKKKVAFNRKLTFWGAFLPGPDEPKRVIIEVGGDPQPWTGAIGEMIDGTPYRVEKLINGDMDVVLVNPTNPKEKPVVLPFEGSKDDPSRARGAADKQVDELFGGKAPVDPAAPAPAPGPGDPAGGGSLEPAFDR